MTKNTSLDKRRRLISRLTSWTLRGMVVVTILFFIAVFMAAGLGGSGEIQRKSLEDVIAQIFGQPATIHKLNMYQIFPTQRVDFEGLVIVPEGAREPAALIERALYVNHPIRAWFGGHPIRKIAFDNFMTKPGFFGPYSLHLKQGRIDQGPTFVMTGTYGPRTLKVVMPMESTGEGTQSRYRFDGTKQILVDIGAVHVSFQMRILEDKIALVPLTLKTKQKNYEGSLTVPRGAETDKFPILKISEPNGKIIFDGPVKNFSDVSRFIETPSP